MHTRNRISNIIFGQRLRHARLRRNLAQDELGVIAGLEESSSSARMSRYENGVHAPPIQFVDALAHVLEISPAYFFCPDDQLADLIFIYSNLSDRKRDTVYKTALSLAEPSALEP